MDILSALSSQTIGIILFIATMTGIRLYSDIKEIMVVRHTQRLAQSAAQKHKTPRITGLIELDSATEAIFPLLDHIYSQRYANLEVIILIKQSADKNATAKLTAYRRKHHIKLLKFVKQAKMATNEAIIRQKATGELIIPLSYANRLSNHFFANIAIDSLDREVDVLMPRQHLATGTTLMSAYQVVQYTWQYIWTRFNKANVVKGLKNGYVYRRDELLRRPSMTVTMHCSLSYTTGVITSVPIAPSFAQTAKDILPLKTSMLLGTMMGAVFIFTTAFISEYSALPLMELLPLGYVVIYALFMSSIKEYTIIEKISHILFAPFSILTFILLYLVAIGLYLLKQIKYAGSNLKRKLISPKSIS